MRFKGWQLKQLETKQGNSLVVVAAGVLAVVLCLLGGIVRDGGGSAVAAGSSSSDELLTSQLVPADLLSRLPAGAHIVGGVDSGIRLSLAISQPLWTLLGTHLLHTGISSMNLALRSKGSWYSEAFSEPGPVPQSVRVEITHTIHGTLFHVAASVVVRQLASLDNQLFPTRTTRQVGSCDLPASRAAGSAYITYRPPVRGGLSSYELRTTVGVGCVFASIPQTSDILVVQGESRQMVGRPASLCVWTNAHGSCLVTKPLSSSNYWTRFTLTLYAPSATQLQLYVYQPAGGSTLFRRVRTFSVRMARRVIILEDLGCPVRNGGAISVPTVSLAVLKSVMATRRC